MPKSNLLICFLQNIQIKYSCKYCQIFKKTISKIFIFQFHTDIASETLKNGELNLFLIKLEVLNEKPKTCAVDGICI